MVCTNSGIKVYDINLELLSLQVLAHQRGPGEDCSSEVPDSFLKYKLSVLPNEKIVDIVTLRQSGQAANLLLCTNFGQYVLIKSDSYLVQWRFTGYNNTQTQHTPMPPRGLINFLDLEYEGPSD